MEVVENSLGVELDAFLARPLFCFLGTVAGGEPRVTPLWFRWEEGAVWIIANEEKSYPAQVERTPEAALGIVDFDRSTGRVQHVGMRGTATVEPHDPERATRLLESYLGPDPETWDHARFPDPHEWGPEMVMLRFEPGTVVARDQSYVPAPTVEE